jgi:uncharacterized protein (TIGR02466 family)
MTESTLNIVEHSCILQLKSVFTKEECAEVSRQILNYKDTTSNIKDTVMSMNANASCWMGRPQENGGFTPAIETLLITKILEACDKYYDALPKPTNMHTLNTNYLDKSEWHVRAWCNVNDPDSENFMHSHPGKIISGVIYFQAEETGCLEFVSHNYLYKLSNPAWPFHGTSVYEPKDGDMLLFPSYLLHRIQRNTSNKQRINMAFDAMFLDKE